MTPNPCTRLTACPYATLQPRQRVSAEQGYAPAQLNLGAMYDNGHGVPQNYAEAVKWYRLAAEQGYGSPQYNLGQMYQFGRGVPQNGAEAVKWYRLAARQGHTKSQLNLGGIYNSGEGVLQVNQTAHMWYNIGAANGNVLGGTLRELVALNMTPTSIEEAQRRARVCMESNYQDCD